MGDLPLADERRLVDELDRGVEASSPERLCDLDGFERRCARPVPVGLDHVPAIRTQDADEAVGAGPSREIRRAIRM
jgi:hypothetical protein